MLVKMEHLSQILERLNRERLEYVLVGGLAGVYHGVPLVTRDVDICMPFTEQNLGQLEKALSGLNPVTQEESFLHRQTPQLLPFRLTEDFPRGLKNLYLRTDLGILDCLGKIKGVGGFAEVNRQSIVADLPIGLCRILSLPALIQAKAAMERTQDKLALLHLREIQKRKQAQ
jgi:hypothetical protein